MLGLLGSLFKFYCLLVVGTLILTAVGATFSPVIGGVAHWIYAIPQSVKELAIICFWVALIVMLAIEVLGLREPEAAHPQPEKARLTPLQSRDRARAAPAVIDVEYEVAAPASSQRRTSLPGSVRD